MVTDKFKTSMSKQVYLALREQILSSKLKPGNRLIEMNIATEQNVSRTPVREALKQLEKDGLVSTFPRKGSIVSKISVGSALEMMDVQGALLALALKLMAQSKAEKPPAQLNHQLNLMKEALESHEKEQFIKAYRDFLNAIMSTSKNVPLRQMLSEANLYLQRMIPVSLLKEGRFKELTEELEAIIKAVKDNDFHSIDQSVQQHILRMKEEIKGNVDYRNFRK